MTHKILMSLITLSFFWGCKNNSENANDLYSDIALIVASIDYFSNYELSGSQKNIPILSMNGPFVESESSKSTTVAIGVYNETINAKIIFQKSAQGLWAMTDVDSKLTKKSYPRVATSDDVKLFLKQYKIKELAKIQCQLNSEVKNIAQKLGKDVNDVAYELMDYDDDKLNMPKEYRKYIELRSSFEELFNNSILGETDKNNGIKKWELHEKSFNYISAYLMCTCSDFNFYKGSM